MRIIKLVLSVQRGTIKSDIYAKKFMQRISKHKVASLATPLLAPMIEEGFSTTKSAGLLSLLTWIAENFQN